MTLSREAFRARLKARTAAAQDKGITAIVLDPSQPAPKSEPEAVRVLASLSPRPHGTRACLARGCSTWFAPRAPHITRCDACLAREIAQRNASGRCMDCSLELTEGTDGHGTLCQDCEADSHNVPSTLAGNCTGCDACEPGYTAAIVGPPEDKAELARELDAMHDEQPAQEEPKPLGPFDPEATCNNGCERHALKSSKRGLCDECEEVEKAVCQDFERSKLVLRETIRANKLTETLIREQQRTNALLESLLSRMGAKVPSKPATQSETLPPDERAKLEALTFAANKLKSEGKATDLDAVRALARKYHGADSTVKRFMALDLD